MKKILKFEAEWCQPCRVLTKALEGSNLPIEVVNVDENITQTTVYGVRGVPTLVFLNDQGVEVDRLVGAVSKDKVIKTFEKI